MTRKKIVLLGYMGCGKTIVGQYVSQFLEWDFVDLDDYISSSENKFISDIFYLKGEIGFRKIEHNALNEVLNKDNSFVLSLGGGTPCYYNHMEDLATRSDILSIYLETSIPELTLRLYPEKSHRPLINHIKDLDSLKEFIGKHIFERKHCYNQADLKISTDFKSPNEVASEIVAHLFQ